MSIASFINLLASYSFIGCVLMKRLFYIEPGEAIEILISVLAISFAFTLLFTGPSSIFSNPKEFFVFMALSLVTVGSGFILHEMGHKIAAIYFGAYARFQMWVQGLVFMIITSLFGFLFAAPGAVYIYSQNIGKKENGIISLCGPLVNIMLMFVFFLLSIIFPRYLYFSFDLSFLSSLFQGSSFEVWRFGAYINLVLGMFNMLPAYPLDGSKIFNWSKLVWAAFLFLVFIIGLNMGLISLGYAIAWVVMLVIWVIISSLIFGKRQ